MRPVLIVVLGEMKKYILNYNNSISTLLSLLIWPALVLMSTFFTYSSFDSSYLYLFNINTQNDLMLFVITGALGYNCFWSMVQSAFYMSKERQNGTLEIVYLTPASRFGILYGRALGGLLQSTWMFIIFSALMMVMYGGLNFKSVVRIPFGLVIVLVSATVWGGFINSIFLFSRDTSFWFNICDEPMNLLSGTKIPVNAFPYFIRFVSALFPLTHCNYIIRSIFSDNAITVISVIKLIISLLFLIIVTIIIEIMSERNNRKTGNLQLY